MDSDLRQNDGYIIRIVYMLFREMVTTFLLFNARYNFCFPKQLIPLE